MKKLLLLLLCLTMLSGTAMAGGLPNLSGGTLPLLNPAQQGDAGVLPDPAEVLGAEGTVFAEDYAYTATYLCTVYTYPPCADSAAFVSAYQALAAANGFAAENTQVDGFQALKLSYGGQYALLFPEYSSAVMLMVPNGMVFGEPLPEGNYVSFTRNGRTISTGPNAKVSLHKGKGMYGMGDTFEIVCYFEEQPVGHFVLNLPSYAIEGDSFYCTQNALEELVQFYTDTDEYMVFWDDSYGDDLEGSKDFFSLKITRMIKEEDYVLIEGAFEGTFGNGELVYEKGSFRADMHR